MGMFFRKAEQQIKEAIDEFNRDPSFETYGRLFLLVKDYEEDYKESYGYVPTAELTGLWKIIDSKNQSVIDAFNALPYQEKKQYIKY